MNPSLDDLKRLEKESQHLYDNAHDDMSDYFKDVLELIFTHERLMQSHEQLQSKFNEAVEVIKFYSNGGNLSRDIWFDEKLGYFTGKRARDFLRSLEGEK